MTARKRLCTRLSDDDFLHLDGPTGKPCAWDDTRNSFFHNLGFRERSYRHLRLYIRMKKEARAGMERLFANRECLQPELIDDQGIQPPYAPSQMTEQAFRQEVNRIYASASLQTKGIYDLIDTGYGNNWVIRWMLFRVIQASVRVQTCANISDVGSDISIPTVCSPTVDQSSYRPRSSSHPSPHMSWVSTYFGPKDFNDSDSEDWSEPECTKIKLEHRASPRKANSHLSFWDQVMNT